MYYVNYTDEGPVGFCGQCMSITSNWNKLYIFESANDVQKFMESLNLSKSRKNPKVIGVWQTMDEEYIIGNEAIERKVMV